MSAFINDDPSLETKWRSLILFGKNSATYKFAFAKSMLDQAETGKSFVSLEDLALPYAKYIIEHLKINDKQGNAQSSKFLNACRSRRSGTITDDELHGITIKYGFVNVVDAFQNLQGGQISDPFYRKDENFQKTGRLVITDQLLSLKNTFQFRNLRSEVEARWRLVETAWSNNISPNLLEVKYDESENLLFIKSDVMDRVDVTSSRDALSGYQKGKCFYCADDISIIKGNDSICHVDHFLPHSHKREHLPANINGVWNLVLSCQSCNGAGEKSDRVPDMRFLERLNARNEFYISSKHPLAETIVNQTGKLKADRISFLKAHYQISRDYNQTTPWFPKNVYPSTI